MKIKYFMYTLLVTAILFSGCKQLSAPDNNGNTGVNTELKKQRLYQNIQGLWKHDNMDSYIFFGEYKNEYDPYKSKIFPSEGGIPKPYSSYEICTTYERLRAQNLYDDFQGMTWTIFTEQMNTASKNITNYSNCLLACKKDDDGNSFVQIYTVDENKLSQETSWGVNKVKFTRVNTSGSSGGAVTLSGNYEIKEANGSTFSMNSGNWTFQYNSRTKNGTYTQSSNDVTINYSQGYLNVSAVFTVSKSGEIITLTKKSGDATTIISSVFMVTDANAISNGVIKLAAK